MIVYDLQCGEGHHFEGWFEDLKAYEKQKEKKIITCLICNSPHVSKVPSTFGIKNTSAAPPPGTHEQATIANLAENISKYIQKNFDDVGCDFAKEALKIHYGAAEPRNIRGISTEAEEKTLKQEGVKFFKFPTRVSSDSDS